MGTRIWAKAGVLFLLLVLWISVAGCAMGGGDGSGSASLEGMWICELDENSEFGVDTMIVNFQDGMFWYFGQEGSVQVEGWRGTYTLSGSSLTWNTSQIWNAGN